MDNLADLVDAWLDGFPERFFPPEMDRSLAGNLGFSFGSGNHTDSLRPLGNLPHAGGPPVAHASADLSAHLDRRLLVRALEKIRTYKNFFNHQGTKFTKKVKNEDFGLNIKDLLGAIDALAVKDLLLENILFLLYTILDHGRLQIPGIDRQGC
jgi:hypothetical protein